MILTSERLKINQIKKRVGDAWVLIYNPEYTEKNKLAGGDLIFFDNDNLNEPGSFRKFRL